MIERKIVEYIALVLPAANMHIPKLLAFLDGAESLITLYHVTHSFS